MFHHGPRHVIQIPKDKMLLQNLQNKAPVFGAYLGRTNIQMLVIPRQVPTLHQEALPFTDLLGAAVSWKTLTLWGLENLTWNVQKKTQPV